MHNFNKNRWQTLLNKMNNKKKDRIIAFRKYYFKKN